jgi:outer membrane immunogenic protein
MRLGRLVTSIALIASGTLLNAHAASAADLPSKAVGAPSAPGLTSADWSGFYLGGHLGWGAALSRGTYDDGADTGPIDFAAGGFLYGAQAGYNWQFGRLVYGVEVDGTWDNLNSSRTDVDGDRQKNETNFLGSARFRSGAAIDNFYFFGSVGVGYAQSKFTVTGDVPNSASRHLNGWGLTSGFGVDYAITPNWSVRGEYLYYAITKREGIPDLTNDSDPRDFAKIDGIHVVRLAANYRFGEFGGGSPARVSVGPAMDWSGFYVGAHGGYGRSRILGVYDEIGDTGAFDFDPTGFVGGVHLGYNMQRGAFVYGLEADGSWGGLTNDRIDDEGDKQTLKTNALGSIRGRIGVAAANQLYYLTAGWGVVNSKLTVVEAGNSVSKSFTSNGFVFGSGFEWAFNPNWSARVEALAYLMDDKHPIPALTADSDPQDFVRQDLVTMLRAGVSYRFATY